MAQIHVDAGKLGYEKNKDQLAAYSKQQRVDAINKFKTINATCLFCGKSIPYEKRGNKFCNRSHAASYNNLGHSRNVNYIINDKGEIVRKPKPRCLYCNKELDRYNKKYCDNDCQQLYQWREVKHEIVRTGICPHTTQMRSAKKYLIEENGQKCMICGTTEWTGKPVPLELDHINGNYEDNRVVNLRMICGNCGMLLPTYKNRNMGNGRHSRRERYKQSKSY